MSNGIVRLTVFYNTADNQRYTLSFNMPDDRFFDPVVVGQEFPFISTAFYGGGTHRDLNTATNIKSIEIDHGTFRASSFDLVPQGRIIVEFAGKVYQR